MTKNDCVGCRQDFYNDKNDLGVRECWSFKTAKLIPRRQVGMNDVPPWTAKPRQTPSCYSRPGFIYVDPKVTS